MDDTQKPVKSSELTFFHVNKTEAIMFAAGVGVTTAVVSIVAPIAAAKVGDAFIDAITLAKSKTKKNKSETRKAEKSK